MTCKTAICDDCAADIEYLTSLVNAWASASGYTAVIKAFLSAESFLFQYEEEKDFDLLLLDIEMGGLNGVGLAKKIRQQNERVQIIFITGFPDFMAEGYEVAALHYLMKPVLPEKLNQALDRAAANLGKQEKLLKVVFDRQTDFIPLDEILYLEAQKQFVCIHTAGQVYRMKSSLREMETELDKRFFKCQRSFLVNLHFVVRIKAKCVVLKNGEEVPISRGMADAVSRAIIELF